MYKFIGEEVAKLKKEAHWCVSSALKDLDYVRGQAAGWFQDLYLQVLATTI